ncbi:hypothetical protein [Dawidia soli]|uniref:Uncharacterized protein n=1 Tax=Dawidia soli TaxID=2782352 RepID=A0AAP2GGF1_9BACT|nr:hypothetical protein [Dawidia soli]MBT1690484.1 hypothetical protein [Dawidia soli]
MRRLRLLLALIFFSMGCHAQKAIQIIDGIYIERDTLSFPIKNETIVENDVIVFDIPGFGDFLTENQILLKDVRILFNNIPIPEFAAYVENMESGVVRFQFLEDALGQESRKLLYNLQDGATKEIQLGIKAGENAVNYPIRVKVFFADIKDWSTIGLVLIVGFILFFLIIVFQFPSLIKDSLPFVSDAVTARFQASYSFGKTQMAFWTFIVVSSFIYIWAYTTDLNSINTTALILLGISSTTLAAASAVSKQKEIAAAGNGTAGELVESRLTTGSFFKDILSDAYGININRFQVFIFNVVFGVAFIRSVIFDYSMPLFDETQLLLLGISNGTYVFLKTTESK